MIPEDGPRLGAHLSNHGSAAQTLELARLADAESLDSVWLSEDLFYRGAMPVAGAVAASTSGIRIGFGVLTPQLRHVALLAMDTSALTELAGPRVILGLGAGVAARTRALDVESANPLATVRDVVEVFRRLTAGESVTRSSGTLRASGLELSFEDRPAAPPVYVAAVGPKSLEQAGRIADGVILSLMSSHRYAAWALERIRAGLDGAARATDLPVVIYVPFVVARRRADALAALKPLIASYLRRWVPIDSLAPLFTEWSPYAEAEVRKMTDALEDGRAPGAVIPDDLVLDYCIAGSLDECREQIGRYSALGITDLVIDLNGDMEARQSAIRALARLRPEGR